MEDQLANVKIGDKLIIKRGHYDKGCIATVDRITPSGRVITKLGVFNPSGTKRGDDGWYLTRARMATNDDIANICQYLLVKKLETFRKWSDLSAEDLKSAAEIIGKYDAPH